ncbi:hypothetical protein EMPS_11565 [Entomortierella parvispora]|uniref:Sterol regulatory element-binding protein cleavage-activating protein n=1 Tax=Entomortierella parvispora TaxID=205924 RepID=A0A9P3HMI3_9FUNG|nr:hypothetical protein EMPS_11565 [Entomortierella parvispora]
MSALSRIPGLAPLVGAIASSFSLRANPTLRRYNDALAQRFYHHGRLCASNQATVMVLVILFVGMISYPGIVASYNSSAYVRQRSSIQSVSLSFSPRPPFVPSGVTINHAGDALKSSRPVSRPFTRQVPDLDTFWLNKIMAPTWSQDPDVFDGRLPSKDPLVLIAPLIINASNLFPDEFNAEAALDHNGTFAGLNLFAYASQIQEKIRSIKVELDSSTDGVNRGVSQVVTLKDICLQSPPGSVVGSSDHQGSASQSAAGNCIVHSPALQRDGDDKGGLHGGSMNANGDDDRLDNSQDLLSNIFSGVVPGDEHSPMLPKSLVITFFLRGDLADSKSKEAQPGNYKDLDVRRIWALIIDRLRSNLAEEAADALHRPLEKEDNVAHMAIQTGSIRTFDTGNVSRSSLSAEDQRAEFWARVIPAIEGGGSKRIVSEEYARPRTNISAEYWLLGMAYFVMFLYISLSVGRVDLVKSKYGLGIAAVATVFVSLLMSIGLCSVFGVTLTLMPWEILPFMIIVVGVENINILVHAVVETSMDLPVKERVGRGLGAVGVSITLTLAAELCLLAIGAMTTIPAVQEFCTFAIAAVIMDYLLQMTFFITVISIDIRRLELSDLAIRPVYPTYSRYQFNPQHDPATRTGVSVGSSETARLLLHPTSTTRHSAENNWNRQQRRDSADSAHAENDVESSSRKTRPNPKGRIFTSIMMVGVMGYLGYIYGTTSQVVQGTHGPALVSYWRLESSEASAEFWSLVDPEQTGGFLELQSPAVISLSRFSSTVNETDCLDISTGTTRAIECIAGEDDTLREVDGVGGSQDPALKDDKVGPSRFRLLWTAILSTCLFFFWLVRVFVIPSIILAAAILLLLSYLLSPQRKLLVDLQWSFPFIVLPGDYQSKRKLMEEALLAAEAKELAQNQGLCTPLPGAVDTLCFGGHQTDIDQMDVSTEGSHILTSSMDGIILLWSSIHSQDARTPIAQLKERPQGHSIRKHQSSMPSTNKRAVRCLKIHRKGIFAAVGFADGTVLIWKCDSAPGLGRNQVPSLISEMELCRTPDSHGDVSKSRVVSMCFWDPSLGRHFDGSLPKSILIVGYRDGDIWQWDLESGKGRRLMETKLRGGISELQITALSAQTQVDLRLRPQFYLLVAGRDGGIQCWSTPQSEGSLWAMRWSHSGVGIGVSVSVLCVNPEVPMLATGYSNGAVKVWDLEHGNPVWTLSRGNTSTIVNGKLSNESRRRSQGPMDSHQPSHTGAVTRLFFHALELEDGLTGEPAPRVWLVLSSGVDETVMVWAIEWEGLLCLPEAAVSESISRKSLHSSSPSRDPISPIPTEPILEEVGSRNVSDLLTSSLPVPRLVGYIKQRGGKSMAVGDTCVYGIRRTESSTSACSTAWTAKRAHASVSDILGSGSNTIRSRRKSEGGSNVLQASNSEDIHNEGFAPAKRGWEVWEADLYQCIFKDPGVWGLDLAVRAINLQPHTYKGQYSQTSAIVPPHIQFQDRPSEHVDLPQILVSSNGSGMAVHVPADKEFLVGRADGSYPRPRLQRRPGSFSTGTSSHQQGYVYTGGSGALSANLHLNPMASNSQEVHEGLEPTLLPFVEARLIHVVSRPGSGQGHGDMSRTGGASGRDVVVGFGNWIKVVHLQDEDQEEAENSV